jgi:hypothetical protein
MKMNQHRQETRHASLLRRTLLLATIGVVCVVASGCEKQWQNAALTGLQSSFQDLKETRDLVEAFGRDVKKVFTPDDQAYTESQAKYVAAKAAYEGYLTAAKMALLEGVDSQGLNEAASNATAAATEFVAEATKRLNPTINTRSIPFNTIMAMPTRLPAIPRAIPVSARAASFRSVEPQLTWSSWAAL